MKKFILAIVICLIVFGAGVNHRQSTADVGVYVPVDTFYYNRTDDGMESGTIRVTQYTVDIHHGTYWESYPIDSVDYDEAEQLYVFHAKDSVDIVFDPSMHEMRVGDRTYYINSTIKSNW